MKENKNLVACPKCGKTDIDKGMIRPEKVPSPDVHERLVKRCPGCGHGIERSIVRRKP